MSKAPAVDYAIKILELFSSTTKELGISDISNQTGINKNAVSRIIDALVEKNWIYCIDDFSKKYSITARPFSLFAKHFGETKLSLIAAPLLDELHATLGDTVYVGVKSLDKVLYVLHKESTKVVRISAMTGGTYPLHSTAPGKILLANSDDEYIEEYYSTLYDDLGTANSIRSDKDFIEEKKKIISDGYAIDNEEFAKGIVCISVPIYDASNKVVASLGLSSLTIYDSPETLVIQKLPHLKNTAEKISALLGQIKIK